MGKFDTKMYIFPLLLFLFCMTSCGEPPSLRTSRIDVDRSSPEGKSQFVPAISHVDTTFNDSHTNNARGTLRAMTSLLKQAIPFQNTFIMAWGVPDPWPDPGQNEPGNWHVLDSRVKRIAQNGGIPVITLNEAPWWMKGHLEPDGSTRQLDRSEEWQEIAYQSRILDNKMDKWLHLVQRVAERYMVPPYNVRYFQVWNEMKGYYNCITNTYDYTTAAGDPSKSGATHGYTYMYNLVYQRLMQVATTLGISPAAVQIGGPYVVIDTWSSGQQSHPSLLTTAYGTYDQRPLDVIKYWLRHKTGAGFITLDGHNGNRDEVDIADPFKSANKFGDVLRWIRALDEKTYPGASTLPLWWAEIYTLPPNGADDHYTNALKAYAMVQFIKAGGTACFFWGGTGNEHADHGLWNIAADGQLHPLTWYYTYKALGEYFPPGTALYKTTNSTPESIETLASTHTIILINKSGAETVVSLNGHRVMLNPYQVSMLAYQ
jgi:hypothetical protein